MKHLARAIFLIVGLTLPAPGFPQSQAQSPETAKRELPNRLTTAPSLEQQRTLFSVVRETLPEDDPKVIRWLRDNADYLAPSFLFELSRRLMAIDEADAMEWFTVARMRANTTLYDAPTAVPGKVSRGCHKLLSRWPFTGNPIAKNMAVQG